VLEHESAIKIFCPSAVRRQQQNAWKEWSDLKKKKTSGEHWGGGVSDGYRSCNRHTDSEDIESSSKHQTPTGNQPKLISKLKRKKLLSTHLPALVAYGNLRVAQTTFHECASTRRRKFPGRITTDERDVKSNGLSSDSDQEIRKIGKEGEERYMSTKADFEKNHYKGLKTTEPPDGGRRILGTTRILLRLLLRLVLCPTYGPCVPLLPAFGPHRLRLPFLNLSTLHASRRYFDNAQYFQTWPRE
ncbi:unnamed protein product, partial [Nesidiocoris tenuis]